MFKWLNKMDVEKVGEFRLLRVDRFHYEYAEESGLTLQFIVEDGRLKGKHYQEIFLSKALAHLAKPDADRVRGNVTAALAFKGIQFKAS